MINDLQNDIPDGLNIDSQGNKMWYLNGVLHRTDGPAVEWINGYRSWWLHGKRVIKSQVQPKSLHNMRVCVKCAEKEYGNKTWVKRPHKYCVACSKKLAEEKASQAIDIEKIRAFLRRGGKKKSVKELAAEIMREVAIYKVEKKKLFLR